MSIPRFKLALEHTDAAHWKDFEGLASIFLASQYPELRPMGTPSGDHGRDAELYSPVGVPQVLFQFSTANDWKSKISRTIRRIQETFPDCHTLVYVSPREIGAQADSTKKAALSDHKLTLDIRDREWFSVRYAMDPNVERHADDYARKLVNPLLENSGLIRHRPAALTQEEAQAALIYLELQWEDDTREKGLTKLCFEALVRSVLRETDPEHRMRRSEVLARVRSILPSHKGEQIDAYTNAALERLKKRAVRHWMQQDEFCLSHEERERLADRLSSIEYNASRFTKEILQRLQDRTEGRGDVAERITERAPYIKEIIERFLLSRGESFARAIHLGTLQNPELNSIKDIAISTSTRFKGITAADISVCTEIAKDILTSPSDSTLSHLQQLGRAYTLMAFLQETPDVQTATKKMFGQGEIWLDTSVLLPVFAETLLEDPERGYTRMLQAAREADIKLHVTHGVLEELNAHVRRCRAYEGSRTEKHGRWRGRVPFLSAAFRINRPLESRFAAWVEQFAGEAQPTEDIAEYLYDVFGVGVDSLLEEVDKADQAARSSVKEAWIAIHQARRES